MRVTIFFLALGILSATDAQTTVPAVSSVKPRGQTAENTADQKKAITLDKAAPIFVDVEPGFQIVFAETLNGLAPLDRANEFRRLWTPIYSSPESRKVALSFKSDKILDQFLYDGKVLLNITDADATSVDKTRRALSREYEERFLKILDAKDRARDSEHILRGLIYSGVATVGLIVFLFLLSRGYRRLVKFCESLRTGRMPSLRLQNLEVLSASRATDILLWFLRWLRIAVVLLAFYFYLPIIFSFFPWTKNFAELLFGYIRTPLGNFGSAVLAYIPNLFSLVVIWFVTRYLLKLIRIVFDEIGRGTMNFPGFHAEWSQPTYKILRFLVLAFAAVMAFPYLPGSNSPAFQGISIFLGVLFSMGSTAAVANFVAGTVLTYMRPFQIGDRVKIADTMGEVMERNMLVTRIRTIKNVEVTIANSLILGNHIINYSSGARTEGLILHTKITIGYDVPWVQVHELLKLAALEVEDILQEPAPFVLQTALDDWYVEYELNAYTREAKKMAAIYSRLHEKIQDHFNEAGVEIMSPHFYGLRDGGAVNIPEKYRSPDYRPTPLTVEVKRGK